MGVITATRYHDISCGHRVHNHESKCAHLHGHNYRIHFTVEAAGAEQTDEIGRVIDFSVIKSLLCEWLEEHWDHRFIIWTEDPILNDRIFDPDESQMSGKVFDLFSSSLIPVPFNPTAENMAKYLVEVIGPQQLEGTGTRLISVTVDETAKCSATYLLK